MSFNNFGTVFFLRAGQSLRIFYLFGNGDRGFQHAGADIKTPNNGAEVVAFDQSKKLPTAGQATYFVSFLNRGPGDVFFNIQGGGAA
jgi:hypothetical protein